MSEARLKADKIWRKKMKDAGFIWKSVFIPEHRLEEFKHLMSVWAELHKEKNLEKATKDTGEIPN